MSDIKLRIVNDAFHHRTENQMSDILRSSRSFEPDRSGALKRCTSDAMLPNGLALETVELNRNRLYVPTRHFGTAPTSPVTGRRKKQPLKCSAGSIDVWGNISDSRDTDSVCSCSSSVSQGSISLTRDSADMAACLQILIDTQSFENFPFEDFFDPEKLMVDPRDTEGLLLGRGAEATCFLGTLKGRSVAVKTSYSDSVLREYSLIHGLNHPNIIKPVGFTLIPSSIINDEFSASEPEGGEGDVMFLACYEFALNRDLASYLHDHPNKRKDDYFVTSVLDSILSGLEYLHEKEILHGDIKPENILIMEDGRACIADFGLCQSFSDDMIAQGTPSYMAPEVLAGWCNLSQVRFTAAADIFSFGVLLVRALTGKYPFARITARLHQRIKFSAAEIEGFFHTPQDLLKQLDSISPKFAVIAKMCLRVNPSERPSASDLRKVLQLLSN